MVFEKGSCSSSMNVIENAAEVGGSSNSATERKFSVLIVDDDSILRRIHKTLLRKLGLEIEMVGNGQQAVDLHYLGSSYDLIFMDMEMPVMDGHEATRELRSMGVESMIVGITSRDLDSEKDAFIAAGLNYCFVKPLTPEMVIPLLVELNGNKN